MSSFDLLGVAVDSLRANVLRTSLTMLGIVIGVAAVIAMVAIGAGAESRVQNLIQNLGTNILVVQNGTSMSSGARGGAGTQPSLTEGDAEAIGREIISVEISAPSVRGVGQLVYGNMNWSTALQGITPDYFDARNWVIAHGRNFSDVDVRSAAKVAVIGQTVADKLLPGQDPVGQMIRIARVPFTVIGVLQAKGQTPFGSDQDDILFLPLSTAKKRVIGGRQARGDLVANITVKVRDAESIAEAEHDLKELLRLRHRLRPGQPDDFHVRNVSQFLEARAESSRVMALLLASVAGVSLIVGGIGIMNIMLVSVTERTREIGLRMAVGARNRDIMLQFVLEAVALSLVGGVVGIVLGSASSMALATFGDWPTIIQAEAIIIAVGFSAAVGVFFGYYPARKAARLDPIESLRHE